jgi:hypothetical protein
MPRYYTARISGQSQRPRGDGSFIAAICARDCAVLARLAKKSVRDLELTGPMVALTYRATVDVPARFRNSKAVGAVFGGRDHAPHVG